MTEVAKLVTEIVADTSKFKGEINEAKGQVGSFVGAIKAGSIIAVAALTAIAGAASLVTKEIFESAEKVSTLYDNTQKLNISVAAFQELSVAAKEAGVSAESLQNLISNMNKRLGEAKLSGGAAATALKALGLSFKDLQGLSPDQQFQLLASRLRELKDVQLETAIASDLFGKAGKDGIGLFNSNIDESINKVRELGITLTQSQAAGLDKLAETKDLIGTVWEGFKNNVAAEVAPAFQQMLSGILESVKGMGGLKEAAKSTADFIIGAMKAMEAAIGFAVQAMRIAKGVWEDVSNSFIGEGVGKLRDAVKFIANDFKSLYDSNVRGIESLIRANSGANSKWRDNGPIFGSSTVGKKQAGSDSSVDASIAAAESQIKIQNISLTDANSRALSVYNSQTKEATKALELLKKQAEKAATVLDSFHAIKDALNAPGKEQAKSIIDQATSSQNTGSVLADTAKFQQVFNQILKDVQKGNTLDGWGKSEIPGMLKTLQDIINTEKDRRFTEAGVREGKDVSGLVTALNELKGFLAQKSGPKDQLVEVKIKVDAGKDFVTTVTTSQSFKQAVDAEFDARTAAAARGNIP